MHGRRHKVLPAMPSSMHGGSRREPNLLSLAFADEMHAQYLADPDAVPEDWQAYFGAQPRNGHGPAPTGPDFAPATIFRSDGNGKTVPKDVAMVIRQDWVDQLIRAYRSFGHLKAKLDPLGGERPGPGALRPGHYGFSDKDMERTFSADTLSAPGEPQMRTLRQIVERLENTYCRSIGVEFMHLDDPKMQKWLRERMEQCENRLRLSRAEQVRILHRLMDAEVFEDFLAKRFQGKKRFALSGAESLIPLLDLAIEGAGAAGVRQMMFGMAHRGRLNVLANILRKEPRWIFRELDDPEADGSRYIGRGDVKYHLGYSIDVATASGKTVHLSLCFNPSHLEFVNPIALGRVRAMQDRDHDPDGERELTVLIHGDAAFIGEGIAQETFNLSKLPGYRTGGTLHVVVNNQIGFTTPDTQARSTSYATDIAKMLPIPVLHVNGEDPEAVAQAVRLALDFRQEFRQDVVIDLYCYRTYGHNETDEPAVTQPLMYQSIRARKSVFHSYFEHLKATAGVTPAEVEAERELKWERLERALQEARDPAYAHKDLYHDQRINRLWKHYAGGEDANAAEAATAVPAERLSTLLRKLCVLPAGFAPHKNVERVLQQRERIAAGQAPVDWSAAEALAFATLATDPTPTRVRFTGQDSERGTFSHRHAVLFDQNTGKRWMPLEHLAFDQAPVQIFNSPLSETAVLGFEWGYSLKSPDSLVLWEAQFGDFANVAQVVIDQFISSAEDKWGLLSGLVLLLPHGFEGQGPEHSSARLERFLALAAEDNMQIVNLTTPAQIFHCLRRQVVRPWRKPLVVMTPKSLLRSEHAASPLADLAEGAFQRVIPDAAVAPAAAKRVLLCSGKVYYDLLQRRTAANRTDVAIVRLEQLYPLSLPDLAKALAPYAAETPVVWVQEEPRNMGAWYFLNVHLGPRLLDRHPLSVVSRPESASPATGSHAAHILEQQELVRQAMG